MAQFENRVNNKADESKAAFPDWKDFSCEYVMEPWLLQHHPKTNTKGYPETANDHWRAEYPKWKQISVIFLHNKTNTIFPLRNFLMQERIRKSCVQRYHKTLEENTKPSRTEHRRKQKQKAGLHHRRRKGELGDSLIWLHRLSFWNHRQ